MANNLLTISAITNQALNVLENELKGYENYVIIKKHTGWAIQLTRWGQYVSTVAEYPNKGDAEAVLKMINFSEGKPNGND